ncbi:hypothetical protein BDR03DRAFT_943306 [Suillus americanus]|nr:hypothetical protein BDR03DRAFT_943306 [Suillus americanus]
MESDFDVCVECGSLVECDHDHETLPAVPSRGAYSLPGVCKPDLALEIDTLDMCSIKPILPHSEVFNTYGSLSNAELISRYGFTLPENEHDIMWYCTLPPTVVTMPTCRGDYRSESEP